MKLIIRKHTLTKNFPSKYFGNFGKLLEVDLSNEQIDALFSFFESVEILKTTMRPLITDEEAYPTKFFVNEQLPLVGYTSIGFIDIDTYKNVMCNSEEHKQLINTTNNIWNLLGWSMTPAKTVTISVGEFDEESAMYNGYPITFKEIDSLWKSANF